jgi:hypothetical protein
METIQQKLDRLSELRSAAEAIRLTMDAATNAVITDEQRKQIADIRLEFQPQIDAAAEAAAALEAEIKAEVIAAGASVKSERLQAIYIKGRVSWDTKALEGVAATIPQIAKFRKEGEPSVSFRVVA